MKARSSTSPTLRRAASRRLCRLRGNQGRVTRSLARELAPKIRVNAATPGAILWPQSEPDEAEKQKVLTTIPLARLGSPDDIARAVAFLATEPYLSGVILPVDGGRSLG